MSTMNGYRLLWQIDTKESMETNVEWACQHYEKRFRQPATVVFVKIGTPLPTVSGVGIDAVRYVTRGTIQVA
jgi:hypothetical protein